MVSPAGPAPMMATLESLAKGGSVGLVLSFANFAADMASSLPRSKLVTLVWVMPVTAYKSLEQAQLVQV